MCDSNPLRQRGRDWNEIETDYDAEESVENTFFVNTTSWDMNDVVTIKNIFGYRKLEFKNHTDTDGTALPMFGSWTEGTANTIGTITSSSAPQNSVDTDQYSNELQLLFTGLMDDHLEAIAGAYYFNMDGSQDSPTQLLPIVRQNSPKGDAENTAYALFGEGTYSFNDQWAVTAGVRQSWDEREATFKNTRRDVCLVQDDSGVKLPDDQCAKKVDEDFDKLTWRLVGSWTPQETMLNYASISTGYKAGGFNLRAEIPEQQMPFDEETVITYEIGNKTDWDLGDWSLVRTNIAIYYQDYEDIQKTQAISTGGFGTATGNAAKATISGLDFDVLLIPTDGLELRLAYAYVDTEYDEYDEFVPETGMIEDVSDRDFTWIPEHSGTASLRYTLPLDASIGEVSLGGSYYYQGKLTVTDDVSEYNIPGIDNGPLNDTIEVDSSGVWDVRADWADVMQSNFDLALWVKNAGDEDYKVGGLTVLTSLGWAAFAYGAPRTVGASLRYRF